MSTRYALVLWLATLPILLIALGRPPVTRSQEARVMLSAQELAVKPISQWVVPSLNGQPRYQKPPLAAWLTAGAFKLIGVNDFAGRLPAALAGWFTIAIVFCWAKSIAGDPAGVMAAGGMLGSIYFFRYTRLAETDAIATPFVALSFWAVWQATRPREALIAPAGRRSDLFWFHIAAAGAALATMAKGGPGLFPLVFLLALSLVRHDAQSIVRLFRSGAMVTYAVIAIPWFTYAWLTPDARNVMAYETSLMVRGGGHGEPFYEYFLWIAYGCLPWTLLGAAAIVRASVGFRRDQSSRELLIAALSVFVPLCLIGQKQPHYVMPLIPILFVLTGVEVQRMLAEAENRRVLARLFAATVTGACLAAVVLSGVEIIDSTPDGWAYVLATIIVLAAAFSVREFARRGSWPAFATLGAAMPVVQLIAFSYFWPIESRKPDPRALARVLQEKLGDAPAAWWGENDALAVTFYLHRLLPSYDEDPATPPPPPPRDVILIDCDDIDEINLTPTGYREVFSKNIAGERLMVFEPIARGDSNQAD